MMHRRLLALAAPAAVAAAIIGYERVDVAGGAGAARAAASLQSPEQFLGFKVGADNKLVRWDKIVEYMKLAAAGSDRIRYRELGKTSQGNSLIALEIASVGFIGFLLGAT